MKSLESNEHVKHFLLGNNIIGPAGARAISQFASTFPNRMETWYLAGNCIDTPSFHLLSSQFHRSQVLHSLWLKRNPLGSGAADDLYLIVKSVPTLRTLDLDQTELGDVGVARLFTLMAEHAATTSDRLGLRHIYLNGDGIGEQGSSAIASYIASPQCQLESIFLSCNPIGDKGSFALSHGLQKNISLLRLTLSSCGLKNPGATAIVRALFHHPKLQFLDMGTSYATADLGQRYNWLEDGFEKEIIELLTHLRSIKLLNLGITALTHPALESIAPAVVQSTLCLYLIGSMYPAVNRKERPRIKIEIRAALERNIEQQYGPEMTRELFEEGPLRFLRNTEDVRFIDSVYRNRDMQKARKKEMVLEKWWEEEDETLKEVAAS